VELPVRITPSLRKYWAACAVSSILTSDVILWALKHRDNNIIVKGLIKNKKD
jgi:hypothetical protein